MTNKATKKALLLSTLSLLLCFAMLLGTTFAWFTDSVTSSGNIIKAGNLAIDLIHNTGTADISIKDNANHKIFDYANWEPGYTQVETLTIANKGSLALKYEMTAKVENAVLGTKGENLADVIDVYMCFGQSTAQSAADLADTSKWWKIGTLAEWMGAECLTSGKILPEGSTYNGTLYGQDGVMIGSQTVSIALHMKEEAGNEYQGLSVGDIGLILSATQWTYEDDSFGPEYDKKATYSVSTAEDLQTAITNAVNGDVIVLGNDIKGNLELVQKPNTKFVIDGNGSTIEGGITLDGKSATYTTAGVLIQNVNFKAGDMSALEGADACIRLGNGTNATRYLCNVTVENCTFDIPGAVGVKSYTGGDKNLTIRNCTAKADMHSLVQVAGVDGLVIENCQVYSKNGINVNQSDNVTIKGCTVDTTGYAVRFGAGSGNTGAAETYLIENCSLKSANDEGDATIILRGTADDSTLTIRNTTITGSPDIANTATGATVVK